MLVLAGGTVDVGLVLGPRPVYQSVSHGQVARVGGGAVGGDGDGEAVGSGASTSAVETVAVGQAVALAAAIGKVVAQVIVSRFRYETMLS